MKRIFRTLITAFIVATATVAALAADDAVLGKILDAPSEQVFIGRFSRVLLDVPAGEIRSFRENVVRGMDAKTLPDRYYWQVLGLVDTRWAEVDRAAFIAACREGKLRISNAGMQQAIMLQLESDMEESIRLLFELKMADHFGDWKFKYLAAITNKDPQRAVALLKEMPAEYRTDICAAVIRTWALKDADAAWRGISAVTRADGEVINMKATVFVTAARKDPAHALRLFESEEGIAERSKIRQGIFQILGRYDAGGLALDFARKWNTPEAWMEFTVAAKFGTGEETIRRLIEVLPKEYFARCMEAFFTWEGENSDLQPFPHTALLPLLPDKEMRTAIILAIIEKRGDSPRQFPVAVCDAAIGVGLDQLLGKASDASRRRLIQAIGRKTPELILPYLKQLSDSEWENVASAVVYSWPNARIGEDTRRFLASSDRREIALGRKLAEQWWRADPVAAFPDVIEKHGKRLAYELNGELFLKGCGGDAKRAEAMLASITDKEVRNAAMNTLKQWKIANMPPREALDGALALLEGKSDNDLENACANIANRQEPEFDTLIAGIADSRLAVRDKLLAMRAGQLFSQGQQERAFHLLRQVRDDETFLSALRNRLYNLPKAGTDWGSILEMAALRSASRMRTSVFEGLSNQVARYAPDQGLAFAKKTTCTELADCLLTVLAAKVQDAESLADAMVVVNSLPAERKTPAMLSAWQDASTRANPASAWTQALKLGLDTDDGMKLGRNAITNLAQRDTKAAIDLLIKAGPPALRGQIFEQVVQSLVVNDPIAAFRSAPEMPEQMRDAIRYSAISAWAQMDHEAACKACMEITSPETRASLHETAIGNWLRKDAEGAMAWILALKDSKMRQSSLQRAIVVMAGSDPAKSAVLYLENQSEKWNADAAAQIARGLAKRDYVKACEFLIRVAEKSSAENVKQCWREIFAGWFKADPAAAGSHLLALKKTPLTDALNADMAAAFLPRYKGALAGWSQQPALAAFSENNLEDRTTGIRAAASRNFAETRAAVFAMESDTLKVSALRLLLSYAVEAGLDDQFIPLFHELSENGDEDVASKAILNRYIQFAPDRALLFLKSIAKKQPRIVTMFAKQMAMQWMDDPRGRATALAALRLLPDKERLQFADDLMRKKRGITQELADVFIEPSSEKSPLAANFAAMNDALLINDPIAALQAAVLLPIPDADSLLCRILASFSTRKDADLAVKTIPSALARERVNVWLNTLGLR